MVMFPEFTNKNLIHFQIPSELHQVILLYQEIRVLENEIYVNTKEQRHKGIETQRIRDTKEQRHKEIETQGNRDTREQRHKGIETQKDRDTK